MWLAYIGGVLVDVCMLHVTEFLIYNLYGTVKNGEKRTENKGKIL